MKIKLHTMDLQIRNMLGWDSKMEEEFETQAQTLLDFFKEVKDKDGRTLYDRVMDDNDMVLANSYAFFNCKALIKKDEFSRPIEDGDKIVLLRSLAGCGGG
ncbi:MAG: hypothetical protein LBV07_02310 [Syntrophobacterales bacterium]|nr:hypothetical protein [Syntrophobacterales bacterium]